MTAQVLTITLKGDGSGLTGTLRTASGEVKQFGATLDASTGKVNATGAASRRASRDVDAFGESSKRANGGAREWASGLNMLRGTLATLGISLVVREMLNAGLAAQRLNYSMMAATGSQTAAAREMGFVRAEAQRLGIYMPTLAQGYISLAAATRGTSLEGEKTRKIFTSIAEAGRAMNLSAESMTGIFTAIQQIAGKGTVSMEELRQQLGDRLPGAMQIAARAMGMTVSEFVKLVSEGKILSDDFLPKFATALHTASEAAATLNANSPAATFERLKTALFDAGAALANGGVLNTLASAASALTSTLNLLVNSGALQTLAVLTLKFAFAASIFFVGSKLYAGLAALRIAWVAQSIALNTANIGLGAAAAGTARLSVAQTAAALSARGLGVALNFVKANPVMLAVTAVISLVTWLYTSAEAAKQAATELREGFKSAKQALDEFNKSPSLEAIFTLQDAKIGEQIERITEKLRELRKERAALAAAGGHMGFLEVGKSTNIANSSAAAEVARYKMQLEELNQAQARASNSMADMVTQLAGVKSVAPQVRDELNAVTTAWISGDESLSEVMPKYQSIIEKHYGLEAAARLSKQEIINFGSAISAVGNDMDGYAKRLNGILVQMAGIKGGAAAATRIQIGQDINARAMEFGAGDRDRGMQIMRQTGELAKYGEQLKLLVTAEAGLAKAQEDQAEARKQATEAQRNQRKEQREGLRDDAAATRATLSLNTLIRDQQNLYAGPIQQAMNDYADAVQRIDKVETDLRDHNRLNAAAQGLLTRAREESAAAHVRNLEIAKREASDIARKTDLVGETASAYAEETRQMLGSVREREVQRALIEAETAARQQYSKGLRANIDLQAEEITGIRAAVEQGFNGRRIAVEQQQYAQEVGRAWVGAANDGAHAFGDWFANGFKGAKDFASQLKNIFKRLVSDLVGMFLQKSLVRPFQNMLEQANGFNSAGGQQQQGGYGQVLGNMFNTGMDKLTGFFGNLFGRGGAAQTAVSAGTGTAMDGWFSQLRGNGGLFGMAGNGGGGVVMANGQPAGAAFGGLSPWMGAMGGAVAGYNMGGDTAGKIAGGLAGGIVGYGAIAAGSVLAGGGSAAAAAGAFGSLGGASAVAAIPVIGWIALAAFAVNAISGGKLFGTKYKTDSAAQQFSIGEDGASGFTSVSESGQKSFFRGKKYRTTTTALDAEGQKAVQDLFDALSKTVTQASQALGVDIPDLVGGTFRREFDAKGNLTKEFGTIAGRVYAEGQEAFAARLVGENLLNVAKQAGSAAELETLANAYRSTGEELQAFAALALAVQSDLKNANGIWKQVSGDDVMTRIVGYIEGIAKAGESMAEAYGRVSQTIAQYGDLIGGVRTQIATQGLNQYQKAQLDVEVAYRAQVKQANDLAKALGLTGARSEDLASIEQLRAINMAALDKQYQQQQQNQNQQWLQDMSLSNLSPLRDDQKLTKAMELLQQAASGGDAAGARKLAEQALGLGRNLYASGQDYNDLYAQVTGLVGDMGVTSMEELQGLTNDQLASLADIVSGLPAQIAQEMAALLLAQSAVPAPPEALPLPPPPPNVQPVPPGAGGGGGTGGGGGIDQCVAFDMFMDDDLRAIDAEAGNLHDCLDPQEGATRKPLLVAGRPVIQPCVRLVTTSGAALVCSRSTPFTDIAATEDTPEWTHYAPAMRGKWVYVQRGGVVDAELVTSVQDIGDRFVVPLDFGGRSFPAGEQRSVLIYSHNMQKGPGRNLALMSDESPRVLELLADIADTNKRMESQGAAAQIDAINSGTRTRLVSY